MKRIAITGAGGQIAYHVIFRAASGDLFKNQELIALHLCDVSGSESVLEGIAMELEDCAFPLLKEIRIGTNPYEMFKEADLALLIGAKPRGLGMERRDLLKDNGIIFQEQGKALNASASRQVKVLVVGNPCNTNCLIAMTHAPDLPKKNFHALVRLDQNRAVAQLAKKAQVEVRRVTCMTIWGNHSMTQIPDFTNARIDNRSVEEIIQDKDWLHENFMHTVQNRGAQIIQARGKSSVASAANAVVDAVNSLYQPTPEGEWFSSAVCTDNNSYGLEENLIFGFPCRSKGDGDYEIVDELPWNFYIREKMTITQKELISEKECVQELLGMNGRRNSF